MPELTVVKLGGVEERFQALDRGTIDAAFLPAGIPPSELSDDFSMLYQTEVAFAQEVFVVPNADLEDPRNIEFFAKFLKLIQHSIEYIRSNRDSSITFPNYPLDARMRIC